MKQPKHKRTAAQAEAAKKFAAAGRASQHRKRAYELAHHLPTRTKAQTQASLKWAAKGRAAQARKASGLKPLPKKAAALAACHPKCSDCLNSNRCCGRHVNESGGLHDRPVCAAVAVAEHLYDATGIAVPDADIIRLGDSLAGGCLLDYLEAATGGSPGCGWPGSGSVTRTSSPPAWCTGCR